MSCPAEHSFSDGSQNIHVALVDPAVTCPVPESPPVVLSILGVFAPITFATILALELAILSQCAFTVVHTPVVVSAMFKRNILGSHEDFRTSLHFARH